jgi:hypothetical protein
MPSFFVQCGQKDESRDRVRIPITPETCLEFSISDARLFVPGDQTNWTITENGNYAISDVTVVPRQDDLRPDPPLRIFSGS